MSCAAIAAVPPGGSIDNEWERLRFRRRVRFVVNTAYDGAHQASVTLNTIIKTCRRLCFTSEPSVKVRVGRHLQARVRQQKAGDVGEAGVDVLPDVLQLLVLVLLHLNADAGALPAAKYHRR